VDRIIIDTHFLVSLFVESSPYFERAKEIVKDKMVYIPINIVLEFIFLTVKKLGIDEKIVFKKLEEIHSNATILEITEKDLLEAYLLMKKHKLSLKNLNDVLLLLFAKRTNFVLVTFDENLRKIAEKEGIKIYPK